MRSTTLVTCRAGCPHWKNGFREVLILCHSSKEADKMFLAWSPHRHDCLGSIGDGCWAPADAAGQAQTQAAQ